MLAAAVRCSSKGGGRRSAGARGQRDAGLVAGAASAATQSWEMAVRAKGDLVGGLVRRWQRGIRSSEQLCCRLVLYEGIPARRLAAAPPVAATENNRTGKERFLDSRTPTSNITHQVNAGELRKRRPTRTI